MIIKFKNWEKYQETHGKAKAPECPAWFRFQNRIPEHELWEELDPLEFKFFVFMLCFASRNGNRGLIHTKYRAHSRMTGIDEKVIIRTIKKLKQLRVIEIRTQNGLWTDSEPSDTEVCLTDRQTDKTDNISPISSAEFDFEILYKKYPRKEGKKKGLVICKAQIKTQEGFDSVFKAISRYAEHCSKNAVEPKFIKHFSTFMASWQDWLDPETGKTLETVAELSYGAQKILGEIKK